MIQFSPYPTTATWVVHVKGAELHRFGAGIVEEQWTGYVKVRFLEKGAKKYHIGIYAVDKVTFLAPYIPLQIYRKD